MFEGKQGGATFITCLILIMACMLVTSALIENSLLEFRGKTNYIQKAVALNAAENTVAEIKARLSHLKEPVSPQFYCSHPFCIHSFRKISWAEISNLEWWQQAAMLISLENDNQENYVFIQELNQINDPVRELSKVYCEVLVLSHNKQNKSLVVLKVVFLKQFDLKNQIVYPAVRVAWQQLK